MLKLPLPIQILFLGNFGIGFDDGGQKARLFFKMILQIAMFSLFVFIPKFMIKVVMVKSLDGIVMFFLLLDVGGFCLIG